MSRQTAFCESAAGEWTPYPIARLAAPATAIVDGATAAVPAKNSVLLATLDFARIALHQEGGASMQERFSSIALALFAAGSVAALLNAQPVSVSQPGSVSFPNDIDPILERSCRSCHGDTAPMGRLDLSTRESLLRGGTRGVDLVPGSAAESRLYRRVAGLEQPTMPAKGAP